MKTIIDQLGLIGLIPVAVIEDADNAVPTARAMARGGIPAIEITMRTAAGLESIRRVSEQCPDIIVGAGTVTNLQDAKRCVEAGAKFIVSPGFGREMVEWCVSANITVIPGCVTPSEIMEAMELGLNVLKFFPANLYGGLAAMKALSGPFGGIKFIPTGGVDMNIICEYLAAPFIHAAGGSWICSKSDISQKNFDKITELCAEAVKAIVGFEVAHVGINTPNEEAAANVGHTLHEIFGFEVKEGNSSAFVTPRIEVMKSTLLGKNGHLAVHTNNINRAIAYLENKNFAVDKSTLKSKNGNAISVYLKDEVAGFAIHLLQK